MASLYNVTPLPIPVGAVSADPPELLPRNAPLPVATCCHLVVRYIMLHLGENGSARHGLYDSTAGYVGRGTTPAWRLCFGLGENGKTP